MDAIWRNKAVSDTHIHGLECHDIDNRICTCAMCSQMCFEVATNWPRMASAIAGRPLAAL